MSKGSIADNLEEQARTSPIINIVLNVFSWIVIPVRVFFRRDFGERHFSSMTFFIGAFVLGWLSIIQRANGFGLSPRMGKIPFYQNGQQIPEEVETASFFERFMSNSMSFILVAYVLLSAFHFFKIWWRNRTNTPLHSYDDGTSHLQPLAAGLMDVLNMALTPLTLLMMRIFLPEKERQGLTGIPLHLNDTESFTDRFLEPAAMLLLAWVVGYLGGGTASTWLVWSSVAVFLFATLKHDELLHKWLNMRDSAIEIKIMIQNKEYFETITRDPTADIEPPKISSQEKMIMEQIAANVQETPAVAEKMKQSYPDLMDIIEEMNVPKSKVVAV